MSPETPIEKQFTIIVEAKNVKFLRQNLERLQLEYGSLYDGAGRGYAFAEFVKAALGFYEYRGSAHHESSPSTQVVRQVQSERVAAPQLGDADSDWMVFTWFDEEQPKPSTQVLEVVVTARAYQGVISIFRQLRGSDTGTKAGLSVLDTNYHPPTQALGKFIAGSPWKSAKVVQWDDEMLSETTPVMHFHMTQFCYNNVTNAIGHLRVGTFTPHKRKPAG